MQKAAEYRKYEEECLRLAQLVSAKHREALLRLAEAWRQCAQDAERSREDRPEIVP
jgi:hypothetical protein